MTLPATFSHLSNAWRTLFTLFNPFLFACLLILSLPALAEERPHLIAKVDRTTIEVGDILHLTLEANFQAHQSPDFSRLKDQFDILNQQQSRQFVFANGQLQTLTQWQLSLMPKLPGVAMIPPFTLGKVSSQPIKIHVQPATQSNDQHAPAWLEGQFSPASPYVQQGITYRLRLFYQGQLLDGNLREPELKNALKKRLVNQKEYTKILNQQVYQVIEWVYLFHPLQSGQQTFTPATLNGRLILPNGQLLPLKLHTPAQTVSVKPHPSQYPAQATWLPAESLTLTLTKPLPSHAKVGDTLEITLTLQAKGLRSAQLPTLDFPPSSDYKVYLDDQQTQETVQDQTLVSTRELRYLLIPLKTGTLTLPALKLPWWSTRSNQPQLATLSLPNLQIDASSSTQNTTPPKKSPNITTQIPKAQKPQKSPPPSAQLPTETHLIWTITTTVIILIILLALYLWRRRRSTSKQPPTPVRPATQNGCQAWLAHPNEIPERAQLIALYQQHKPHAIPEWQQLKQHLFSHPLPKETLLSILQTLCQTSRSDPSSSNASTPQTHLTPLYPK